MNGSIKKLLAGSEPFSSLPKEEIQRLAGHVSRKRIEAGTLLAHQNKSGVDGVYLIESGLIELYYEQNGGKILSGYLKPGELFGGISILMNGGIALRTVRVEKTAACMRIPKSEFLNLCTRFHTFNEYFVDTFSKRMLDESYAAIVSASQAFLFLSGVVPFSFLPEEELERVAAELAIVHYPKDTPMAVQGQTRIEYLYIIQRGAVERYYEEDEKKSLRGIIGEGDVYGGIALLLNDGISVRTLSTQEDSYFYILPRKRFLDLCRRYHVFSDYFTDTFGKRMLDKSYASIIKRTAQPQVDTASFFNQPVSTLYSDNIVSCSAESTIQSAALEMSRRHCSSILITSEEGDYLGVVTDSDFRSKVIAQGLPIHHPVSEIMSRTLYGVSAEAPAFEAMMEMLGKNVKHLAVSDNSGKMVGVITNTDMLAAQGHSPFFLLREIKSALTPEEVFNKHGQLPSILRNIISAGAKSQNVNALITTISDAILNRLIQFAIEKLGPPPCPFVFLVLGSEGRMEQTLKTDQDNALIYDETGGSQADTYFIKFGEQVCDWLNSAGYAFCEGGVMAKNPKWCQPLPVWKDYFSTWIRKAEGEALLQASIFFDFRGGYGEQDMVDALRRHMFRSLSGWAGFFRHLTENALFFKPPIGFFRNFVVESRGEHRNTFDIKSAMMPIVDFARVHALHNGIEVTNTQQRLQQLHLKKVLNQQEYQELDQGYSFLMHLRFARQLTAIANEHEKPDNYINPKLLSRIEQTTLKEIFKRIEKFQSKLAFDFTGVA